jgi:hypothetical protein
LALEKRSRQAIDEVLQKQSIPVEQRRARVRALLIDYAKQRDALFTPTQRAIIHDMALLEAKVHNLDAANSTTRP